MKLPAKLFAVLAAALSAFALTSCGMKFDQNGNLSFDGDDLTEPEYVVSIHEIVRYPKAEMIEKEIATYSGTTLYVNTNSLLHSRNIEKIELIPRDDPDYSDLKLTLDKRGYKLWLTLSVLYKGRNLAFVIDGQCYRVFQPRMIVEDPNDTTESSRTVTVEGPFDANVGKRLVKYAPIDYKAFNK